MPKKKKLKQKNKNSELIFKTKKDWVSKALINNREYQKKYKLSIINGFMTVH